MELTEHPTRWKPGHSGNPSGLPGRPVGSRSAFSVNFLRDLGMVWQEEGVAALEVRPVRA
jgi:hypothetical protein